MAAIDALIAARVASPSGIAVGEVPVWNGTTWVRSSVTHVGPSSLGSGSPSSSNFLRGDGTWASVGGAGTSLGLTVSATNTDLAGPGGNTVEYMTITTGGGAVRSIGAATTAGSRLTIKNGSSASVTLNHQLAGGSGAKLSIIGAGDKVLPVGSSNEFVYDGTNWQEINRPAMELIQTVINPGGVAINFASIPQVYTHLRIVGQLRAAGAATTDRLGWQFNSDAAAHYSAQLMGGNNAAAVAAAGAGQTSTIQGTYNDIWANSAAVNSFSAIVADIPTYANTGIQKSIIYSTGQLSSALNALTYGWWNSTAAITAITAQPTQVLASFNAGSTLSLYGITG
jgi:hypothetical protein